MTWARSRLSNYNPWKNESLIEDLGIFPMTWLRFENHDLWLQWCNRRPLTTIILVYPSYCRRCFYVLVDDVNLAPANYQSSNLRIESWEWEWEWEWEMRIEGWKMKMKFKVGMIGEWENKRRHEDLMDEGWSGCIYRGFKEIFNICFWVFWIILIIKWPKILIFIIILIRIPLGNLVKKCW